MNAILALGEYLVAVAMIVISMFMMLVGMIAGTGEVFRYRRIKSL